MIIKIRYVKKPRRVYYCGNCKARIAGPHFYVYGMAFIGDPPYSLRECIACVRQSSNPKLIAAVQAMEAAAQ